MADSLRPPPYASAVSNQRMPGVPGGVHDRERLLLRLPCAEELRGRADPAEVAAPEDDPRHAPSLRWSRGGLDLPRRQPGRAAAARRTAPSSSSTRIRPSTPVARRRGRRSRPSRTPTATAPASRAAATDAPSRAELVPRLVRRLPRLPRAAPARAPPAAAPTGTLYLHLDYREAHYVSSCCDELFGREQFLNEIIWAYDYGARAKRRWPAKHDTILVYVKDARDYYFDSEAVDREPYMAPGARHAEKAARGQAADRRVVAHDRFADRQGEDRLPDAETARRDPPLRPGLYPRRRLVPRSFAGSGTLGAAAADLGRRYVSSIRIQRECA